LSLQYAGFTRVLTQYQRNFPPKNQVRFILR